jgi:hypothetical protein
LDYTIDGVTARSVRQRAKAVGTDAELHAIDLLAE